MIELLKNRRFPAKNQSVFDFQRNTRHSQKVNLKITEISAGNKSTLPDDGDIEAICKTINYELGQAMFDNGLQLTVAKNIEKAVGVFVAKVEGSFFRNF